MKKSDEQRASDRDLATGLVAIRSWKRDGTRNTMSLEMAAQNLASRAQDEEVRQAGVQGIRIRLVAGQTLATPQAVFRLA